MEPPQLAFGPALGFLDDSDAFRLRFALREVILRRKVWTCFGLLER